MPTIAVYVPARLWRAHGQDVLAVRHICREALEASAPTPPAVDQRVEPPDPEPDDWVQPPRPVFIPVEATEQHFKPDPKGKK